MTELIPIALYLSALEIEALIQQKIIVAMPRRYLNLGQEFALYPVNITPDRVPQEYYHADFLETVKEIIEQPAFDTIPIKAWAKCEDCKMFDNSEEFENLSQLTIWQKAALDYNLANSSYLFFAYLRVYLLPEAIAISPTPDAKEKLGKIAGLSQPIAIAQSHPVFSDAEFSQQCKQLENRQIPQPKKPKVKNIDSLLDELQKELTNPPIKKPKTITQTPKPTDPRPSDPKPIVTSGDRISPPPPPIIPPENNLKLDENNREWIDKIAEIGNSSNGHEFERLVRKSLVFLGFRNSNENSQASLDPETTGGPGGLDFYAEKPYPIVGECKATKTEKVSDSTAAQLVKLGYKNLQNHYESCLKIIFAAGDLTSHAEQTAIGNKMNVIRPETLERLVQLKATFLGAIDLFTLKSCLEQEPFGETANRKINEYCDRIVAELKLRSQLVEIVKRYPQNLTEFVFVYGTYTCSHPTPILHEQDIYNILVELSSPLTGYLGREKRENWRSDRFYFLRDLTLENL